MNVPEEFVIEGERYEFFEEPIYHFEIDRRQFFKQLGCGLLIVGLTVPALAQESGGGRRRGGRGELLPSTVNAWLHVGQDGIVTVFTGKAELGQNIRTSLSQAVAEELRISVASIKMVMADTDLTPFDMGTFGSQTTPQMASRLHRMGSGAREALLDLAAEHFKVERSTLTVADGKIAKPGGESVSYGELTKNNELVKPVPNDDWVTPAAKWKVAGTSEPKVNGRDFVTGKHKYSSDMIVPGMLHGKVLRRPSFSATLVSADLTAARAMAGVTVVQDDSFIGVAAPTVSEAEHAIESIQAKWNSSPDISNAGLFEHLRQTAKDNGRNDGNSSGSIADELKDAAHKVEAAYTIAYIAHTPLEPRAAVAKWDGDKLTVWTGSQRPFGVRSELANAFGMSEKNVRVIVPDTGSGYGGKHTGEAAVEAARLAKAAGKPVKLVWTRQEEFTWAYFRPAGVIDVHAGVRADGTISAWEFHNYNSGGSGVRTPYDVPHQKCETHASNSPLRQGSYRALASTANHFARESHMDDLAAAVKMDPLEFRLKNLKDERLGAVLRAATEKFGWHEAKPVNGHGIGLACGTEKGSYLATCVEVLADKSSGTVKVIRAVSAFDCGAVVNPNHLKNQIEGALVMGLGGALFEAIEFENGMVTNPRLADYEVPRFSDVPKMEIVLIDGKDIPSAGAGETPIVCIAPAIGNAIFNATGIRLRSMPMVPDGLKS